jgi:hypothetical protein
MGEGSRRGKEGHGERKVKEVRLPASRIALVRPPACGIAPTAAAAAAAHSVPCIHSAPFHRWPMDRCWPMDGMAPNRYDHAHRKMPGDNTKRALEPPQNSQGGTRKTTSYLRELRALGKRRNAQAHILVIAQQSNKTQKLGNADPVTTPCEW